MRRGAMTDRQTPGARNIRYSVRYSVWWTFSLVRSGGLGRPPIGFCSGLRGALCLYQRGIIGIGLIRVSHGKRCNRVIERLALAHVARDCRRFSGAGMPARQRPATEFGIIRQRFVLADFAPPAQPAIFQGPDIELATGGFVLRRAEEDIARGLH